MTRAPLRELLAIPPEQLRTVGHPTRQAILDRLLQVEEASPSELAAEIGKPLGDIAYHVQILAKADVVRQTRTAPVRGALEHFYAVVEREGDAP